MPQIETLERQIPEVFPFYRNIRYPKLSRGRGPFMVRRLVYSSIYRTKQAIALLGLLLLTSCQTNMLKQFSRVEKGMDKNDVMELMGSPVTSTRFHGKDRWMYVMYEDNVRYEREVHFNNNSADYVGEPWQAVPEKKADVVDAKNENYNNAMIAEENERKANAPKAVSDYEKQVRGEDKVRYMPEFTPVQ